MTHLTPFPERSGSFWADYTPPDILIALGSAALIFLSAGIFLRAASNAEPSTAPEIDRGLGTPVRVVPMIDPDIPLLKLGGRHNPNRLPDRWVKPKAKQRVEEKAFVTPTAGTTPKDIPEAKVADAGTPPPPPDAEVAKQVDTPLDVPVDAGPVANVPVEGHEDGVAEGTETDPLKARAVDIYRSRIIAWFSSRFRVSGSGLPQEQLTQLRASASVQLSTDRRVLSYTLIPTGNASFDAAARAALESAKGGQIPPPPENYPDVVQTHISLTFVCKEGKCN